MKLNVNTELSKNVIKYALLSLVYLIIIKKFDAYSMLYTARESLHIEGPLVLIIYYAFYFCLKKGTSRYLVAALPVIVFYIISEYYYRTWGSVFKFTTMKQLPELIEVLDMTSLIAVSVFFIVLPLLYFWFLRPVSINHIFAASITAITFLGVMYMAPAVYLRYFELNRINVSEYSDVESVYNNGRLAMAIYWEAKRRQALRSLYNVSSGHAYLSRDLSQLIGEKRNIHIIVMESFFDPLLMYKMKFSKDPVHPNFRESFNVIGISRSPVFGGRSAQAEFEILCGAPALSEYDDIEFNLFGGGKADCMPNTFASLGYLTIATNAFRPSYFNTDIAYRGLGFSEIHFPQENIKGRTSYFYNGDIQNEGFIFDGVLLDRNLEYIKSKIVDEHSIPIFNYIMTSYGHYPFKIDKNIRPKLISVAGDDSNNVDVIEKLSNQIYYRTAAVSEYLEKLRKVDPAGIIILVGDHLPSLDSPLAINKIGHYAYKKYGYLEEIEDNHMYSMFAYYAKDTIRPKEITEHYKIRELIEDVLVGKQHILVEHKDENTKTNRVLYRERYLFIMSQAVK